jgi:hypothetical protein
VLPLPCLGKKCCKRAKRPSELQGHPYTVTPGGLLGVEASLRALKEGRAQGKKFVCLVPDMPASEGKEGGLVV